jgi:hypothetical protein
VQTNSLFTDGDDGEDVKMPPFKNDDDSFGDATHGFGEEADDVTLSELGSHAVKDRKVVNLWPRRLPIRFVLHKQIKSNLVCYVTCCNSMQAEFGMGIVLRW